jgi:UDP-glucuronate decarboxylase
MVDAIVRMMDTPKGFNGPVNAGNPNEVSILTLAEMIIDITGSSSKIAFRELPEEEPQRRKPDIALAREKLGWSPDVTLEKGLQSTVSFFIEVISR